ncbi:MAG: GHKL domain-containing protein [Deltaproteobacteria bacterium]|nr:GHKL domain-containing protein [Deltaproteobacteria bacterium]
MHSLSTGWDMVKRNIGRISDLVMDLLNYSKERKPEYEVCSPNEIAEEVCKLMDLRAKESGVEIVRDLDPRIGDASLDPKGIHHCLLNLVSNAIDASIFDEDETKKHIVRVATRRESDGTLIFQVSDNGCGMDEAVKKHIFSSLFSTKGSQGTGLGLLVTQKTVHEHGGTIKVDSEPGKGSTFVIRLPSELSRKISQPLMVSSNISEQFRPRGIKVNLKLDRAIPKIMAGRNRLEQIIINLATNARAAIQERRPEEAKEITITTYPEGDWVVAEV